MANTSSSLKDLYSMAETMESMMDSYRSLTYNEIEDNYYDKVILEELYQFTLPQVESFTPSICNSLYLKFPNLKKQESLPKEVDVRYNILHNDLIDIYNKAKSYFEFLKERASIYEDIRKATADYDHYITSPEYIESNKRKIDELKENMLSMEEGSKERSVLEEKINTIESADSLEFIFDRINALKNKELESIKDTFFTKTKGTYVINKYRDKVVKLGLNPDMFKDFISLEENYLGEDYYAFNNLFLFGMMRLVAYSDLSNAKEKLFANTIIISIMKLVYNKYANAEEKNKIINVIKSFDDLFMEYKEYFEENNNTNPNHPSRKEMDERNRLTTIENIKAMYKSYNLPFPENLSFEELITDIKSIRKLMNLKEWLKMYDVEYNDEMTYEELLEVKENFLHPNKDEEIIENKEDIEVTEEPVADNTEFQSYKTAFDGLMQDTPATTCDTLKEIDDYIASHQDEYADDEYVDNN